MFKKLSKKLVEDTKEIVGEEVKKTGKTVKELAIPLAVSFSIGLCLGLIIKSRPATSVVVRVITKAA